jgi:hypothetical protein
MQKADNRQKHSGTTAATDAKSGGNWVSLKTYNARNCRKFCGSSKKKMQAAS